MVKHADGWPVTDLLDNILTQKNFLFGREARKRDGWSPCEGLEGVYQFFVIGRKKRICKCLLHTRRVETDDGSVLYRCHNFSHFNGCDYIDRFTASSAEAKLEQPARTFNLFVDDFNALLFTLP